MVRRHAIPFLSFSTASIRFAQSSDDPPLAEITATRGGLLAEELDRVCREPRTRCCRPCDREGRGSSLLKLLCSLITGYNTGKAVWFQLIWGLGLTPPGQRG